MGIHTKIVAESEVPAGLIVSGAVSIFLPETLTRRFLEALLEVAAERKVWLKANPVSTAGSQSFFQKYIDDRRREHDRLAGIVSAANTLLEPEAHDSLYLEIAASDLDNYLDEDGGKLERAAWALTRGGAA